MISGYNPSILKLFGVSSDGGVGAKVRALADQVAQQRQASATQAARPDRPAKAVTPEQPPEVSDSWREIKAMMLEVLNGTLSPLSEHATKREKMNIEGMEQRGLLYEGFFVESPWLGPGYAKFIDRQVAMMNAYHYTSDLVYEARYEVGNTNRAKFEGAPLGEDAARNKREVERNTALLAAQFNFDTDVVVEGADGRMKLAAFEVRHDKFGLMLSADEKGRITFYDQAGKAYTPSEYAAAQPDGIIPELMNHEAIKAGKVNGRF